MKTNLALRRCSVWLQLAEPSTASWASSWRITFETTCRAIRSHRRKPLTTSSKSSYISEVMQSKSRLWLFSVSCVHPSFKEMNPSRGGGSSVTRLFASCCLWRFLCAPSLRAQAGPEDGGHDLQIWTGGGHGLNGSTSDSGVWTVGRAIRLDFDATRWPWIFARPVRIRGGYCARIHGRPAREARLMGSV